MFFRWYPICLVSLSVAACSGPQGEGKSPEEAAATAAFVVQFAGAYEDPQATAGSVRWLRLNADGTCAVVLAGETEPAEGTFAATTAHELPATLTLDVGAMGTVTLTISDYDGMLHGMREGHPSSLKSASPVGPSETLCDATHGRWLDEKADPATGLYCTCTAGARYIPSQGGCVR